MMEKLQLKHLTPYLPYGLKVLKDNKIYHLRMLDYLDNEMYLAEYGSFGIDADLAKPILKPLSDLTEDNARFLNGDDYMLVCEGECDSYSILLDFKYSSIVKLMERHYDIFGLIDEGLAIDSNTIKE